ncbi:MAG: DUF3098 domain-containing protein [Chitinophagaceae bacterium]|nr:DUF3098 domain-containing protein [Chitinophagaceae bacterium]
MSKVNTSQMFGKENYKWMLIGVVVIAIGMFLLSGGKSNTDPNVFDKAAVYSFTRITVAPILILAGLVIEIFAIFKNPVRQASSGGAKETQ